tara:strand:+ start:113 stop:880 length:768 start_codon:yes stop_codon:yes gene_type:complete
LKEVVTKNLKEHEDIQLSIIDDNETWDNTYLSKPSSLRFWSSFFVILPIFFQAPWVRYQPLSALAFTLVIVSLSIFLYYNFSQKFTIVGSLLLGVAGSWLGGSLFWGWLSSHPILHIPVEAAALPIALIGLRTKWKIGSSFFIASLFGTAMTDIVIFFSGIMDQWMEVVNADPDLAPLILQQTSKTLIHFEPLLIISIAGLVLWLISNFLTNKKKTNSLNKRSLLVSSYVLQTTLVVDGIFVLLALIQPTLSGLV